MNDFDDTLAQSQPQPKRPLSADFTSRIVTRLGAQPKPVSAWAKAKENMKLLVHKPAFALAAIAVMLLGGTAYATTNGFTKVPEFLQPVLGKTETLKNGDRIVHVTTNCTAKYFESYVANHQKIDESVHYYRIKKDSPVTPEQIVTTVQGRCEEAKRLELWNPIMEGLRSQYGTVNAGVEAEKIESITPTALHASNTTHMYQGENKPDDVPYVIDYSVFGPDIRVYSEAMQVIPLSDLKQGQHVTVAYKGFAGISYQNYMSGKVTVAAPVVAIFRISEYTKEATEIWQKYSGDVTQVGPCAANASEWCRLDSQSDPVSSTNTNGAVVNPQNIRVTISGKVTVASQTVHDDYVGYFQQITDATGGNGQAVDITKYTSADFKAQNPMTDPLYCAQEYPVSLTVTDAGNNKVTVVGHWATGQDATIVVQLNTQNKISAVTCAAQ